jgi:gamma-butyrobetaine dioxygenase
MSAFRLCAREDALEVEWEDGSRTSAPWLWLIDNEPGAFHPQTEERTFDLLTVPEDVRPNAVVASDGAIIVTWPGRTAQSRIDIAWLKAMAGRKRSDPGEIAPYLWRSGFLPTRFEASQLLASDALLQSWLIETVRSGVTIVEHVAGNPEAGVAVAQRCGFLRRTNFGVTFEVVSKPDPNNLAYTSHALPLHTDLANQEVPPGFQFLHCIANEAEGGGSVLCDGFQVAADLRRSDPAAFDVLTRTAIPFRFHDRDYDIRGRFPVIVLGRSGSVEEIRFNAHLVDIVDLEGEELTAFYRAYRTFMAMLRSAEYRIAFRLSAGEMMVFDNRRVLHGREAFNPATGFRHLHGCYVDRSEFLSRIRVLARDQNETGNAGQ